MSEKGITLQTVILASILALAAVAVGIVIYNTIADRTEDIEDVSSEILDPFYEAASSTTEIDPRDLDIPFPTYSVDPVNPDDSSGAPRDHTLHNALYTHT